jgi:uncharacterized membrane protein
MLHPSRAVEGNWRGGAEAVSTVSVSRLRGRRWSFVLTERLGNAVVLVAAGVWALGYAKLALDRHWNYGSARFDLGNMVQAVWNTAHGRVLETTLETGVQTSRLAAHVDPILVLFAPAAWFVPTADALLVGQAVALASGAVAVLYLARHRLDSEAAAIFLALAYLASPWIAWETLADFHPVALAIPLFLYAVWFLDTGRYGLFAVMAVLALMCGELMGLPLLALGLWHAVSTHRWLIGSAIAAAGAAWTALCLWVVIPAVGGSHSPFYEYFENVGGSPRGLLHTALTDPGAVAAELTKATDVYYVILLALPLLGLFLLAPLLTLAAVPPLLVNLLSGAPPMTSVREHYVAGVIPFLFAGTVVGLARFGVRRRVMLASLVFETSVLLAIAFAPWPGLAVPDTPAEYRSHESPANRASAFAAMKLIPGDAAVAATGAAGAHLSERRYFYSTLNPRADWVLIDRRDRLVSYGIPMSLAVFEPRLRDNPHWRVIFERGDIVLYKRIEGAAKSSFGQVKS